MKDKILTKGTFRDVLGKRVILVVDRLENWSNSCPQCAFVEMSTQNRTAQDRTSFGPSCYGEANCVGGHYIDEEMFAKFRLQGRV